jgi:predicted RecB family nuclease
VQRVDQQVLHSASDLVQFLGCAHRTTLDLLHLDTPRAKTRDDAQATLIQQKGIAHERAFLATLKARHARVVAIEADRNLRGAARLADQVDTTLAAMRAGVDIVYQATLRDGALLGHADFLRRVPGPSAFGDWHYEVLDTKLARRPQASFLVQLAFYSRLLARVQGVEPVSTWVVTGDEARTEHPFRVADVRHYVDRQLHRYLARVTDLTAPSVPEPCAACALCPWRERCKGEWLANDHLSQVAGLSTPQTRRLEAAGIRTMAALAGMAPGTVVPKVGAQVLECLRSQAALQHRRKQDGVLRHELLPADPDARLGFHRLPAPDAHDLYFDMEGDPLETDGLEYLFGLAGRGIDPKRPGRHAFRAFWAHDRREERLAFEAFIDVVGAHLAAHPGAHAYHYAPYERSALERLMCAHGTREAEVDRLFREHRLVDLYAVVRGAVRLSTPSYSIKQVERFYRGARGGKVVDAGQSVVWYEAWKATREQRLLDDIERYNRDDVESTRGLHEWLLGLRAAGLSWRPLGGVDAGLAAEPKPEDAHRLAQRQVRERLEATLPENAAAWTEDEAMRALAAQLLGFHRREHKPAFWAMYARMSASDEALIEDVECLGGLERDPGVAPVVTKQSTGWTYRFPEQDTKLRAGEMVTLAADGSSVTIEELNQVAGTVRLKRATRSGELPERTGLGPRWPIDDRKLEAALRRFAESLLAGGGVFPAIESLLRRERPRISGHTSGAPLIDPTREALPQIVEAIARLYRSVVFVQGPPGAGKTWTGARVIVELIARGHTVGVASNSHKAIHTLLEAVERVADARGLVFRGAKKCSADTPDTEFAGSRFDNRVKADDIASGGYALVAGTAWLFAEPALEQRLDYLFVDEAGQVSLANLVAMGTSAANLVLLGDPMQLGQPVQGVHPGQSGVSALEYLIDGAATIAPERGIFLERTHRMSPELCRFVSEAVYDRRLVYAANTEGRRLVLDERAHPVLRPAGLRFCRVIHDAYSHRSIEEAHEIVGLLASLFAQRCRDEHGHVRKLTLDDILIVAPYNAQVELLKARLPPGARVGTVDRFQGQEAEVVLVSMTTSSEAYLPRSKAFLYSRNRLNVAVSRARCLAVIVASPALLEARCNSVEDLALVNLLCRAADESARHFDDHRRPARPFVPLPEWR